MTLVYLLGVLLAMVANLWLLVRLFQVKGAVHGILGILSCGLYTLIWSLMNVSTHNLKKPLLLLLAGFILSIAGGALAAPQLIKLQQEQMEKLQSAPAVQPQ